MERGHPASFCAADVVVRDGDVVKNRDDVRVLVTDLDARRYRYLRSRDLDTIERGGVFAGITPANKVINGLDLDAAVDAAMGLPAPTVDPDVAHLTRLLQNILDANDEFRSVLPANWDGDPVDDACKVAKAALTYPEAPLALGDEGTVELAVKLVSRDDEIRSLRTALRSMMCFLHGMRCAGCKAQGRELNERCCKEANCDAGWYGVDAEIISALLELGDALMPGTLAEIEAPADPANQEAGGEPHADAILRDWSLAPLDFGKPFPHYQGAIFSDRKQRFADGDHVRTSPIVSGPDERGIIKTENSTYRLDPFPREDAGDAAAADFTQRRCAHFQSDRDG